MAVSQLPLLTFVCDGVASEAPERRTQDGMGEREGKAMQNAFHAELLPQEPGVRPACCGAGPPTRRAAQRRQPAPPA